MTRVDFMTRLRRGLAGMPAATIEDIAADYDTHFVDAQAAGRSEQEVAEALGNPDRLSRELRAEAGLKKWEQQKNPSAAAAAVFAVLGLGAIDILVLLPILMSVVGTLFAFFVAAFVCVIAGAVVMAAGPFFAPPGGPATAILAGLGVMAGSTFLGAITTVATIGLVNLLVWYGRLHYRLLKPAIDPQG
jgi:uncharacterized membrane protein